MGLDMYLNAKRYIWHNEKELMQKIAEHFPEIGEKDVKEIAVEAGYWRKCNQIHRWFVENVQDNVDNCGEYEVSKEALEELLKVIQEVLANRDTAPTLLPTTNGFFFGGTDYDEYYFQDLESTVEILNECLDPKWDKWQFYYHSSW